jgi:hypothetical protein
MAISYTHFQLLKHLHAQGELPQGGSILEIGEANVYGDFDIASEVGMWPLTGRIDDYGYAKIIYAKLFSTQDVASIDAGGPTAHKFDLNQPCTLNRQFTTVINHGTAEHIFNIAQVFRTMHDHCAVGGLMIHECPFTGWLDHGFYCLQPTLFWDVAHDNGYKMVLMATEHLQSRTYKIYENREQLLEERRRGALADNLMLFVVMRKTKDEQFYVPMQGVYAGTAGDVATQAWKDLR